MNQVTQEIASAAARWVVEHGLDYGSAKRRAVQALGLGSQRVPLPSNDLMLQAVREHIAVFCADTQAQELLALRELALLWMQRLAAFRPYLTGAVWNGSATRQSPIHLQLFCDDPKSAEITLINQGQPFETASAPGLCGQDVAVLNLSLPCPALQERVSLWCWIYDRDDLRRLSKTDASDEALRGDAKAVAALAGCANEGPITKEARP